MQSTFTIDKECKHSRRYAAQDEKFPIQTIYVNRDFADDKETLTVTVEEPEK